MVLMRAVPEPIEVEHRKLQTILKTQMGIFEWAGGMAKKEYSVYLNEILLLLNDDDLLTEAGFQEEYLEGDPDCEEDRTIAKTFVDLVRNTIDMELEHMRYNSCRPPMCFMRLIDRDPEVVTAARTWCETLAHALFEVESLSVQPRGHFYHEFLKDLVWPGTTFNREILIGLWEAQRTRFVPPDIEKEIQLLGRGFNSSVICENGFRALSASGRDHDAGFLSNEAQWHRLIASDILASHDRTYPEIEPSAKYLHPNKIGKATFDFKVQRELSWDHEKLDELKSSELPHLSTHNFDLIPQATENLMNMYMNPDRLQRTWMSLLAVPGDFLFHSDTGMSDGIWVMNASEHAVMGIPGVSKQRNGKTWVELTMTGENPWKQIPITCIDDWWLQPLRVLPPSEFRVHRGNTDMAKRIGFAIEDLPTNLFKGCARTGFKKLTVTNLRKLAKERAVPNITARTTELPLTEALVRAAMPFLSNEEVTQYAMKRFEKRKPPVPSDLDEEDIKACEEVLDDGDVDTAKELIAQMVARAKKGAANTTQAASSGHTGQPSAKRTKRTPSTEVPIADGLTAAEMKLYCPPVKGLLLSKDTSIYKRWKGYYPRDPAKQRYVDQAFSISSDAGALRFVLRGLWAMHLEETQEACPYSNLQ